MHSGVVFWGTKDELRSIMTTLELADTQLQMFETETGGWTLHVNFAGGEVSRLTLENIRLREELNQQLNDAVAGWERDNAKLRADLARALPVVEAAGALVAHRGDAVSYIVGTGFEAKESVLFVALARAVSKGEQR